MSAGLGAQETGGKRGGTQWAVSFKQGTSQDGDLLSWTMSPPFQVRGFLSYVNPCPTYRYDMYKCVLDKQRFLAQVKNKPCAGI
jgi:hypothetical protein